MKGREREREKEESFLRARYRQETKERERERERKMGKERRGRRRQKGGLSAMECLPAEERLEKTTRWLQSRRCFCFPRWEALAGHWEARSKMPRTKKRAAMSGRRSSKKRMR